MVGCKRCVIFVEDTLLFSFTSKDTRPQDAEQFQRARGWEEEVAERGDAPLSAAALHPAAARGREAVPPLWGALHRAGQL